jgi:hypothetical protein
LAFVREVKNLQPLEAIATTFSFTPMLTSAVATLPVRPDPEIRSTGSLHLCVFGTSPSRSAVRYVKRLLPGMFQDFVKLLFGRFRSRALRCICHFDFSPACN